MTNLYLTCDKLPELGTCAFRTSDLVTIGRSEQCQVAIPKGQREVSRVHAVLAWDSEGWHLRDQSAAGTWLDGARVTKGMPVPLTDGARLAIGPYSFNIHLVAEEDRGGASDARYEITVSQVDLAELDNRRILAAALELPARLAEASSEPGVLAVACRYLVSALSPVVASAYVVQASAGDRACSRILAQHHQGGGTPPLVGAHQPTISHRVIERAVREPDSVVFLTRCHPDVSLGATVLAGTNSVGACAIGDGSDGQPMVVYTLGRHALAEGQGLAAEYLTLVATLTRQHLQTLRRARMSKYFSPRVLEMLMQGNGPDNAPGPARVLPATAFFFDLRGFSLAVDTSAADLLRMEQSLSAMIDLVTQVVFEYQGTVIDYQGDAVFAAWGVPFPQADQASLAAHCALEVVRRLALLDLRLMPLPQPTGRAPCGIGLSKGEVLAGTVGSKEMFKYGLLGPAVNVAKRIEGLTKPDALDATVACGKGLAQEICAAGLRTRRLARVRLAGMSRIEDVYELADPDAPHERLWNGEHDQCWDTALAALEAARTVADLAGLEPLLAGLPAGHPRSDWIRRTTRRLGDPALLARWEGVVEQ